MNKRYAVIQKLDDIVINVIMWDGESDWLPPDGTFLVQSDIANIGDHYVDGGFIPPEEIVYL